MTLEWQTAAQQVNDHFTQMNDIFRKFGLDQESIQNNINNLQNLGSEVDNMMGGLFGVPNAAGGLFQTPFGPVVTAPFRQNTSSLFNDKIYAYKKDKPLKNKYLEKLVASKKYLFTYADNKALAQFILEARNLVTSGDFDSAYSIIANVSMLPSKEQ